MAKHAKIDREGVVQLLPDEFAAINNGHAIIPRGGGFDVPLFQQNMVAVRFPDDRTVVMTGAANIKDPQALRQARDLLDQVKRAERAHP